MEHITQCKEKTLENLAHDLYDLYLEKWGVYNNNPLTSREILRASHSQQHITKTKKTDSYSETVPYGLGIQTYVHHGTKVTEVGFWSYTPLLFKQGKGGLRVIIRKNIISRQQTIEVLVRESMGTEAYKEFKSVIKEIADMFHSNIYKQNCYFIHVNEHVYMR